MKTEISNEFILEAHKSACSDWKQRIEKECPELFVPKFKNGDWIKGGKALIRIVDFEKSTAYGFNQYEKWDETNDVFSFKVSPEYWQPATPQEVETALIAEAKKRGYNKKNTISLSKTLSSNHDGYYYNPYNNELYSAKYNCGGMLLFKHGIWAEIIDTKALRIAEMKKELKKLENEKN